MHGHTLYMASNTNDVIVSKLVSYFILLSTSVEIILWLLIKIHLHNTQSKSYSHKELIYYAKLLLV